jgi:hypothetical protein
VLCEKIPYLPLFSGFPGLLENIPNHGILKLLEKLIAAVLDIHDYPHHSRYTSKRNLSAFG